MNLIQGKKAALQKSYSIVEKIMKDRAVSFYQAFRQLPKERFVGVAALYAFCRYADDTVDYTVQGQNLDNPLKKLEFLEKKVHSIYLAGETSLNEPKSDEGGQLWWPAFADTIRRFNIPMDSFLNQIEGQRMDADFKGIHTMEELLEYCRLVAGSVGTMMLPLLAAEGVDTTNPGFIQVCENLGIGMQLTNILRDVGEDLRMRKRLYIPQDLLAEYGVTRTALESLANEPEGAPISADIPEGFMRLWEKLALLADTYYQDYEKWLPWFHQDCQVPLVAAALIYRAIADAVREASYNCFTKRCYTSAETRAALIKESGRRVRCLNPS
ncbi:MAG: squalene/phytoene synthase family protein [Bacteroidia bacterium]|nr:squalene/phytoene synthase family protein [Bacteroidia bacterium]